VHLAQQRAVLQREMCHCKELADQLPAKCMQSADPALSSMCMFLEFIHVVRWEEEDKIDREKCKYRLAVGNMTQLEAFCKPALDFETVLCNLSRGRCGAGWVSDVAVCHTSPPIQTKVLQPYEAAQMGEATVYHKIANTRDELLRELTLR
jgi:hypothetical protein